MKIRFFRQIEESNNENNNYYRFLLKILCVTMYLTDVNS